MITVQEKRWQESISRAFFLTESGQKFSPRSPKTDSKKMPNLPKKVEKIR
jgi:hypothetical protein